MYMDFKEFLDTLVKVVFVPALPVVAGYLIALLQKYTAKIKADINQQALDRYLDLAENAIASAVLATSQTFVDQLKKEERFDLDAQKEALQLSKDRARAIITTAAREAIEQAYGDFNEWMDAKIHEIIRLEK
jgi:uncharacterized protein with von Willebrand factor type A (vWA) domain